VSAVVVMLRTLPGAHGRRRRFTDRIDGLSWPTLGGVLARMRDRTGGPRTRYRLLALLVVIGMLLTAAPLLVPLVSGLLSGLRG